MSLKSQPDQIHLRKYRFPWFLVSLLWLGVVLFITLQIDPILIRDWGLENSYTPLLFAVFLAITSLVMTLTLNLLRAAVLAGLMTLALLMRFWGFGNWLNLTLLFSLLVTVEYMWRLSKEKYDKSVKLDKD